jgi:hypothetical protein
MKAELGPHLRFLQAGSCSAALTVTLLTRTSLAGADGWTSIVIEPRTVAPTGMSGMSHILAVPSTTGLHVQSEGTFEKRSQPDGISVTFTSVASEGPAL